ncbi:putative glyoxalase family protein [Aspergillus lucknowensis]|uniref:VOC domain-containing protein n=1 Tax=Aspergillus lucknowensis TaxID=176173 RepID=A0ABR4LJV6_9EURO
MVRVVPGGNGWGSEGDHPLSQQWMRRRGPYCAGTDFRRRWRHARKCGVNQTRPVPQLNQLLFRGLREEFLVTDSMITGLAHVNLLVPEGTLDQAEAFYGGTLGLTSTPVPYLQKGTLLWFNIGDSGQQVHVAFGVNESLSSRRHPCFKLESPEKLLELQHRIWNHHVRGGDAAPLQADKPGEQSSGAQGVEYPSRFFARDFAGNRLEFSL